MPFDYQMVTFEEIIKNDFFKWAQLFVRPPRVTFFFSLSQGLSFFKGAESGERLFKMSRNKEYMYSLISFRMQNYFVIQFF